MNRIVRNVLIGTGSTLAAAGAVAGASYLVVKKLVGVAVDRKTPKIMEKSKAKLTGTDEMAELILRMDAAEEKLQNSGLETVEIQSHDGLKLVGHWYHNPNAKRVIVAMHGWRSTWTKDLGIISEFWHGNDCSVLYAEQRGQGESGGEYMSFGLLERYDCFDWINWVNERTASSLPVYLGGISMGATTILMTAGLDLPENVKGIAADCGFTSPNAIWRYVVKNNLKIPYSGFKERVADRISKRKMGVGANEYSTIDAMRNCKIPILFIHGSDDHFVPIQMTYENYKACVAPKRLLVVPGAEHGLSYIVNQSLYEETVKKFWSDYDHS